MPTNVSADRKKPPVPPDEKKIERIVNSIAKGCPYKIACAAAGLSYTRFKLVMLQGENDVAAEKDTMQAKYFIKLHEIEEAQLHKGISSIRESDKGHRGEEWYIAKKYWTHYSEKAETLAMAQQLDEINEKINKQDFEKNEKE